MGKCCSKIRGDCCSKTRGDCCSKIRGDCCSKIRGDCCTRKRDKAPKRDLDTTPDPIIGLSEKDRHLITQSWALMADKELRQTNGVEFFIELFRWNPYILGLFPDFQKLSLNEERNSEKLKTHALVVMNKLNSLVEYLDEPEIVAAQVNKLAESHIQIHKVHSDQFKDLAVVFVYFMANLLGWEVATSDVKEAWRKLLTTLAKVVEMKEKEIDGQTAKDNSAIEGIKTSSMTILDSNTSIVL